MLHKKSLLSAFSAALLAAVLCLGAAAQDAPAPAPERIALTLSGDPAHSIDVTWRTEDPAPDAGAQIILANPAGEEAFVQTSLTSSSRYMRLDQAAETVPARSEHTLLDEDHTVHYHKVRFENLEPETAYAYRVGAGETWSEWNQFRTAPANPEHVRFIYLGDAQNDLLSSWSHLVRSAVLDAPDAAFMLIGGDLVNNGEDDSNWEEFFEASGWIYRTMPLLATPGNHEYYAVSQGERDVTWLWQKQFAFAQNGPQGLEGETWYLDYGNVRIISLNSMEDYGVQAEWVRDVLDEAKDRWTIITFHHPVYSSGQGRDNADLREAWMPVFEEAGADLVLSGHDHTYARTMRLLQGEPTPEGPHGVVYLNSVSGPKQYAFNPSYAELFRRTAENTQLYQIVDADADRLQVKAYTADGALYDAFELQRAGQEDVRYIDQTPDTPERRRQIPQQAAQ